MTSTSGLSSSVSGLASGLDTSSIISSLMQVESQQQTNLKTQVTTEQTRIAAYQSVNTKMSTLQTAAENLTSSLTWESAAATSSSSNVVATASAGAPSGSYTFDITSLAKSQVSTVVLPSTGAVTGGSGLDITVGTGDTATTTHVAVTTDDINSVASAINAANLGVKAIVVNTDQGSVLQLNAAKSGTAGSFTVSGLSSDPVDQTSASDAQITVGNPAHGGYTVTSSSNTFTNLIPHVTLTATAQVTGVTVNVTSDASGLANQMQALVDAANGALGEISHQTAYTPAADAAGAGSAGPLMADLGVQDLAQKILSSVASGVSGYGSLSQLGIQTTKDGTLTFDKTAFISAYQANPTVVKGAVQTGLAKTLDTVSTAATDVVSGTLTTSIQGGNDDITSLNDQINQWTTRLSDKQAALQRQFTAMETALGKLKTQSNWLAGQIAGLSSGTSS